MPEVVDFGFQSTNATFELEDLRLEDLEGEHEGSGFCLVDLVLGDEAPGEDVGTPRGNDSAEDLVHGEFVDTWHREGLRETRLVSRGVRRHQVGGGD
jgi:hypothetical protein